MPDPQPTATAVVVLAAGAGTRMRSRRSKMLHEIGGRSLVGHAVATAAAVAEGPLVVVVGHDREQVGPHVQACDPRVGLAVQAEQLGTGHAVQCGLEALGADDLPATVLVTMGDVPLLRPETLAALRDGHRAAGRVVSVLTCVLDDPQGYGRVVRDEAGLVSSIVEQRDADAAQAAITEVNTGIYAFDTAYLVRALAGLDRANAQGEVYLTDVVRDAHAAGLAVGTTTLADPTEAAGVNDRVQLSALGAALNARVVERHQRAGVTVVDPASTWLDVTVELDEDVTLLPGTQLHGATVVGTGAVVGPDTTLRDVVVGAGATVTRTPGSEAVLGAGTTVGPFAYLRPGTRTGEAAKIGTFVETKNAVLGEGTKVPHLSYVGDAEVGDGTNIGAGTIFANYDGVAKHRTVVGRHCRTGSDNVFVAPVRIGDGAVTGAGTVVRGDVPAGALAVSAGRQRHLDGWVHERRPGSAGDAAAREARADEQAVPPADAAG